VIRSSWIACAICAATILVAAAYPGLAATSCTITQVKISPDLRRVVVKTDSPMKEHVVSSLDKPPRLVIEMAGVRPAGVEPTMPPGVRAGLGVRVSGTGSGSQLVLDFGGSPLPQYRIRRVDNYLMVFLGEWTPPSPQALGISPDAPASKAVPQPLLARGQQPIRPVATSKSPVLPQTVPQQRPALPPASTGSGRLSSAKFPSTPGALTIKSAQVIGDSIVLQVAKREKPGHICRLELGIDFDRKRLNLANIETLTDRKPSSTLAATKAPRRVHHPIAGSMIGPRKAAPEYREAGGHFQTGNPSRPAGMAANPGDAENRLQGPRKHCPPQLRATSWGQNQVARPLLGYWSTAATMFRDNRGDRPRSIFPQAFGCAFDPSEID
jgi:hypothetical protein